MLDIEAICLRQEHAVDDTLLITFSDASIDAFGAYIYLSWKLKHNPHKPVLAAAKHRVSPLNVLSTVRLELCAAVVAKRIAQFIEENRFKIKR